MSVSLICLEARFASKQIKLEFASSLITSNSITLDLERYSIMEKTCTTRFTLFEYLRSTHLKVGRLQCSLSNPGLILKFFFRVVMFRRQTRFKSLIFKQQKTDFFKKTLQCSKLFGGGFLNTFNPCRHNSSCNLLCFWLIEHGNLKCKVRS